jgi:hypothetical protein
MNHDLTLTPSPSHSSRWLRHDPLVCFSEHSEHLHIVPQLLGGSDAVTTPTSILNLRRSRPPSPPSSLPPFRMYRVTDSQRMLSASEHAMPGTWMYLPTCSRAECLISSITTLLHND